MYSSKTSTTPSPTVSNKTPPTTPISNIPEAPAGTGVPADQTGNKNCLKWTEWTPKTTPQMPEDWVARRLGYNNPVAAEWPEGSGKWMLGASATGGFISNGALVGYPDKLYSVAAQRSGCGLEPTDNVDEALRIGDVPVCFDFTSRTQFVPYENNECQKGIYSKLNRDFSLVKNS